MEHIKDILDQVQVWHIAVGIYVIGAIWLLWEAKNAPLMPDDYDLPIKDKPKDKTWYGPNDRMRDIVHDKEKFEDEYENQPFGD